MADIIRRRSSTPQQGTRTEFDPFRQVQELLRWAPFAREGWLEAGADFSPDFEVIETNDNYSIRADMPGVSEKDIDVSVSGNMLTISGKREEDKREESDRYYVYERQYGAFSRSFALPETADAERIDARLDSGVLTLTIGKRVEAKPRKIELRK